MILSAHQPAYLPWLGYFDKIKHSDVFVYLDTVQFEKNSFINRNKIKTSQGPLWLTIPVKIKGHTQSTIAKTEIDNGQKWQEKHLKSIFLNYKKASRFETCYPKLQELYGEKFEFLSDLCFSHLQFWLSEWGFKNTKIVKLSTLGIDSKGSDLVLDLCRHFGADHYLSGALGRDYLKEDEFKTQKIAVEYQDFKHPTYPQTGGDFLPFMGIVDLWMNTGDFALKT